MDRQSIMRKLDKGPVALFESNLPSSAGWPTNLLFTDCLAEIRCGSIDDVGETLLKMEKYLDKGFFLAGWFSYECAGAFEEKLGHPKILSDEPLIWMGVFGEPRAISDHDLDVGFSELAPENTDSQGVRLGARGVTRESYVQTVAEIKEHIAAGNIYQANFTFRIDFEVSGHPLGLYSRLRQSQPVGFGSYIDTGDWRILSRSPELFVSRRRDIIQTRPMKGTAPRGHDRTTDDQISAELSHDVKSRAENLMIVDLLRNDFSRIAIPGSVEVTNLFHVETYRSLFQMVSHIKAKLRSKPSLSEIFEALFPCGSVTGAPKIRAMEIIGHYETDPRGIYTGAIGWIAPDRDFCFNVPIRTLVMDRKGKGWLGIGSGIVYDSDPAAEFEECLLKARFLTHPQTETILVETMRWEAEKGYGSLSSHMDRLSKSADYFGLQFDLEEILSELRQQEKSFSKSKVMRVRLLIGADQKISVSAEPLVKPTAGSLVQVRIFDQSVQSSDPRLYHKTLDRPLPYQKAKKKLKNNKIFDFIFKNERGEISEGTFTNLFIKQGAFLLTPPVKSGLLPGILRAELLRSGRVLEAVLRPEDVYAADEIFLGNSVRGLVKARMLLDKKSNS